jgi:predicted Zn-dependent protease
MAARTTDGGGARPVTTSEADGHTVSTAPFLGTFALVLVAIMLLFAGDIVLAAKDRAESQAEAARRYAQGRAEAARGQFDAAISDLRDAVALARDVPAYQLALGRTLTTAGKLPDARQVLGDLLQRDGTSGPANLAMARALARGGQVEDAISYYHRALYGRWTPADSQDLVPVRFELIGLLLPRHDPPALLAELLPLQDITPDSVAMQARLGHLFVLAGSPSRAEEVFQRVLATHPDDAEARVGLAEAALVRGNLRRARTELAVADRLRPADPVIRERLALVDRVGQLDPTARGLDRRAQAARARALVDSTRQAVRACRPTAARPADDSLLARADARLAAPATAAASDGFESDLELALGLWQLRQQRCASPAVALDALSLAMMRIAQ